MQVNNHRDSFRQTINQGKKRQDLHSDKRAINLIWVDKTLAAVLKAKLAFLFGDEVQERKKKEKQN